MNRFILPLLLFSSSMTAYTEIEDLSNLPYLSIDLKERETAKIRLDNGLEILLISDKAADQSAAVVSVGAGSWEDPPEYPGMAHFCEHMLFMGTEKYPDANDFFAQVSNFDGTTNAFTAPNKTVYMFSSHEKGFLSLLDRFAHFFIDPLFNPVNISREMHAVDQEFALQKENDGWREYMVFKETGNPLHQNRLFSTGNSKTLSKIPQSALKQWHQSRYGAERIRVAIYSSLPLDLMKSSVTEIFSLVPRATRNPQDFSQPLTSGSQRNHIIFVEPIQQRNTLSLSWELPKNLSNDPSKSADLVAYALGRGHKHSLLQHLKREHLVDDIRIDLSRQMGIDHAFFEITIELSQKGVLDLESVIARIFQAIAGLKNTNIPKTLFEEKNTLAKLHYQYQKREDAFQYISSLGRTIADEDLSTYPRGILLGSEYNPKNIAETLAFLTPESCCISLLAPASTTKVSYNHQEQWLNVPYTIQPIPSKWALSWVSAKPNPDIRLAEPNLLVPTQLNLLPQAANKSPICIANTDFGIAYYARCNEYQTPESAIHLHLFSPAITQTAKSFVLTTLYLDHLTDSLDPLLKEASSAGLNTRFEVEKNHIHLTVSGFSEKMPLLFKKIIQEMPQNPPSKEQFDLYFARHEKDYANGAKALPIKQAKELLSSLINQGKTTKEENLAALKSLRFEDFTEFFTTLFQTTYVKGLFAGNVSIKTAKTSWNDVLQTFGKSPYPPSEHPQMKALHLPQEEGPFLIAKETSAQGNAAILLVDEGNFSLKNKAAQNILASALQEPFFDTLRTKQKTGYIAQSGDTEFDKRLYQYFLVQSNTHQPEDLLHRFELFLEEYREDFEENVSRSRFETLKASTIDTLKTQCRNIEDKAALFDRLAFEEKGDFAYVEKRIQALNDLTYEDFASLTNDFLSRTNRKRLAILYTGQIPTPFVYLPTTAATLNQVASRN